MIGESTQTTQPTGVPSGDCGDVDLAAQGREDREDPEDSAPDGAIEPAVETVEPPAAQADRAQVSEGLSEPLLVTHSSSDERLSHGIIDGSVTHSTSEPRTEWFKRQTALVIASASVPRTEHNEVATAEHNEVWTAEAETAEAAEAETPDVQGAQGEVS